MPVHPSPAAVLAVTALVRGRERLARASDAERRLVRTVAEWEPGAGLDLTMRCARDGRRVHVEALALGQAPAGWHADIAHAFAPVAQVSLRRRSSRAIPPPIRLAELVRDPLRANRRLEEWPSPQGATGAADVSWPMPVRELADDPAVALRGIPGGFIRTLVAAATPLEISMLHEEMRETWDWMTHPHRDPYFGTPVRLRTFVGVRGEAPRFASLRASVRGWGTGLVLRDADAAERSRFDTLRPDALAGHVRPEGWALAALRLPAAGEQPTPGIVSVVPPVAERPIDTVSAASVDALVLGTAVTATGRRVPVRIDAADLCRHAFVEGRSGAGKTSFLTRVIAELAERGIGSTLLEHHGTGVDAALRALPADAAERALVVRHGDPFAHGTLNLFSDRDPGAREQTIAELRIVNVLHSLVGVDRQRGGRRG